MTTEAQRIADGSALVGHVRAALTQLRAWVAASWIANTSTTITNGLAIAADASALAGGVRALARWTRQSYLYRWLTKEPEPDVVVIDLRETYTVGPVIALLDRLTPLLGRTWRGSRASHLVEHLRTSPKRRWVEKSRTLQLLAAALEPPEPPEDDHRD